MSTGSRCLLPLLLCAARVQGGESPEPGPLLARIRALAPAQVLVLDPAPGPQGTLAWCGKRRGDPGYPALWVVAPGPPGDRPRRLALPAGLHAPRRPRFAPDGTLSVVVRGGGQGVHLSLDPATGRELGRSPLAEPAGPAPAAPPGTPLLLRGARVPGLAGARDLARADVRLAQGRIESVSPRPLRPRPGEAVLEAEGLSLVPGLWDAHVHGVPGMGAELLAAGVTTAVDLGSPWPFEADPEGPRMLWAGSPFDGPVPVWAAAALPCGADDDPGPAARALAARGAGALKAYGALPLPVLGRLAAAGRGLGLPVLVDLPLRTGAVLEVAPSVGFAHAPDPQGDPGVTAGALARAGVVVISTLASQGAPAAWLAGRGGRSRALEPWWEGGGTSGLGAADAQAMARRGRRMEAFLRAYGTQPGRRLLVGTDCGPGVPGLAPGRALADEVVALAALGYPARELLEAATVAPAAYFGDPTRGLVEAGRVADLVLVEGDPARDGAALGRVRKVLLAGRVVGP